MRLDAILEQVETSPKAERAELLGRLLDRYNPEPTEERSNAMKAFVDDRAAKYLANLQNTKSWEEAYAAALALALTRARAGAGAGEGISLPVHLTAEAEDNFSEAFDWFEAGRPLSGLAFASAVRDV